MQLTFTPEEFKALVAIMLCYESEARKESDRTSVRPLADKVMARDLHFASDELEDLEMLLQAHAQQLRSEMDVSTDTSVRERLAQEREVLQHIIDKVTEACAMV